MTTLEIQVPDDALLSLGHGSRSLAREVLLWAAVKLFELGKLSSGRAAELVGMSRVEFLTTLPEYQVGPFEHLDAEDLVSDAANAAWMRDAKRA